jgi:hypothetical protein
LSPFIISLIQRSPKPCDASKCLTAVAVGSGLNEITTITEAVFKIAQLQNSRVGLSM